MKKILKRALILVLCAMFFAACGTTEKSATTDGAKEEKVAKSDKQAAKEQKKAEKEKAKAEKQKAKDKKKAGKSKEAKSGDYLVPIEAAVVAGNYDEAYTLLSDETVQGQLGSDDIYNIDAGMMKLYSNDLPAASQHLGIVADMQKLNEKYADADKVELSTLVADSYSQPYVTYDYEDIYAVIFNAITKLKDPATSDAAFQDLKNIREMLLSMDQYKVALSEKINKKMGTEGESKSSGPDKAAIAFSDSALANYLALIYNKYNDRDGDQKDYFYSQMEEAYKQSSYSGLSMPVKVAEEKNSVSAGKARLNILALMGLMGQKKGDNVEIVPTPIKSITNKMKSNEKIAALGVGVDMLTSTLTGGLGNREMKVKYTTFEPRQNESVKCIVNIAGQDFSLDLIENVDKIAEACTAYDKDFDVKRAKFRAGSRWTTAAVTYCAAVIAAEKKGGMLAGAATMTAGTVFNKALDAIEEKDMADIRGVHYFPAQVQAGAIELNPGTYDVNIKFLNAAGTEIATQTKSVEVKAGQLNLLEVECQK